MITEFPVLEQSLKEIGARFFQGSGNTTADADSQHDFHRIEGNKRQRANEKGLTQRHRFLQQVRVRRRKPNGADEIYNTQG